jgi:hypothetical protein
VLFSILFEKLFHLCYNNVPICFVNILTLSFSESRTELSIFCLLRHSILPSSPCIPLKLSPAQFRNYGRSTVGRKMIVKP